MNVDIIDAVNKLLNMSQISENTTKEQGHPSWNLRKAMGNIGPQLIYIKQWQVFAVC